MLRGVSPWNVLIVELVRSLLNVLFLSVHCTIPRGKILGLYEQVLTPKAFEAFLYSSVFNKAVFCLGENKVC